MPKRLRSSIDGIRATSPNVCAPSAARERSRRFPQPASSLSGRSAKNSCSQPGGISQNPGLAALVASLAAHIEPPKPADTGTPTVRSISSRSRFT